MASLHVGLIPIVSETVQALRFALEASYKGGRMSGISHNGGHRASKTGKKNRLPLSSANPEMKPPTRREKSAAAWARRDTEDELRRPRKPLPLPAY